MRGRFVYHGAVGESLGATLSFHEDGAKRRTGPAPEPVLILALECGRPHSLSARYRLGGLAAVHLGRGSARTAERTSAGAPELTVKVPDKWMSSKHARIEHSFGRWVLVDTESKNGSVVDGHATRRAVLADGAVIELGHTVFLFFERFPIAEDDPADLDLSGSKELAGLTTLVPEIAADLGRLRQIAGSDISILVEGETGTGKEVLARAVHALSNRHGTFVAVNCGALPDNLVESELFGYKRGAFSGATNDTPGLVRSADGGTLFLDEIGDLPPVSQAALLRVLQEREVTPVGGTKPVSIDLRVVAATHRDLDEMVGAGQFRHDLFARLAGFRVEVPPVSDRRADIGLLIGSLHHRLYPAEHPGFEIEAARLLFRYPWPLNVRELEQALATAAVLAGNGPVQPEHLPEHVRTGRPPGAPKPVILSEADAKIRDELVGHLREHRGNVSAVARAMSKDRKQIQRWLKRFGLDTGEYR
jgi:transcriptional regulator with PAS, ATPase and Fis domain